MSKLSTALGELKAGKTDAVSVAKLVQPGGKKEKLTSQAFLRRDAEDPDTEIVPETFDEVSLAFTKGDLSDEQYRAIVAALGKGSAGASSSRS